MNQQFDCVVIGAGPAGIFTALEMKKHRPELSVLVVDSGSEIAKRSCPARTLGRCVNCKPCNILHGWSGAGAFSDGKLSLCSEVGGQVANYVGRDKAEELIAYADSIYMGFGAPDIVHGLNDKKVDEIAYEARRYNIQLISCPVRH